MSFRRWWALSALVVAGCGRGAAPGPEIREAEPTISPAHDTARPAPSPPEPRAGASAARPADPPPAPTPPTFLFTELAPTQGELTPLLVTQFERAKTKQLRPVVEFYADWCPPCRAFQENLEEPRMKEALKGVYLIKLNMDDWHEKLKNTGFTVKAIPMFFFLGADGRPTGKLLDGDKWGKATPANMSASLAKWLAQ